MKIGLVSDIRRAGFLEELSLWVVARALKERGVLSIVLQGAGTSPDSGAKGVLSEFAMEQFTICAVEAELLSSYGIFEQVQGYVTCESPMYDWICTIEDVPLKLEADSDSKNPQQAEKEKKPRIFLEHPMILGHQGRMHEISEKPKEKEAYLFADIKSMTEGKRQWIWQYAQRKQLSTVILFDADSRQVCYLKGKDKPEETAAQRISLKQYIGYIWKSAAVVTDTYCGTTVSTLHEKDFAVFLSDEKKEAEKQQEFLEMLRLADHIADAEQLPEKDYVIVNSQAFRGALHRRRPRLQEQLERELRLERGDLLIKNPVRLPISQCNGCEACVAVCPENAIRMEMNKKGFLYPVVDATSCNECDWCVDVCVKKKNKQFVKYTDEGLPRICVGAVKKKNYTAYSGLYRELMRFVREERDGVIFGSVLNEDLKPVIVGTEDIEKARAFAEQRFLKSRSAEAFREIRRLLDEGRFVMFVGLPCECAGLRGYLKKKYAKLFVCELLCHAVVSEKFFRKYIAFLSAEEKAKVKEIHFGAFPAPTMEETKMFRIKLEGKGEIRRKYSVSRYYQMVEQWIPVKESCANCVYGEMKRVGDLTLGALKEIGRNEIPKKWENYSVIIANTAKGNRVLNRLGEHSRLTTIDQETLFKYQHRKNVTYGKEQAEFFRRLEKEPFRKLIHKK